MYKNISAISCSIYSLCFMLYALCTMLYASCSMLYALFQLRSAKDPPLRLIKPANVGQNVTIQTILSQHCRRKVRLVLSLPKGRSFVFLIAYTVSSSSYKLESSHRAFDSISLNRPTAKITPFSPLCLPMLLGLRVEKIVVAT